MDSAQRIAELVLDDVEAETPTKPERKHKRLAIGAGKGAGILLSVALTAYLSVQEAISDRPTKAEVRDDIAGVKAAHSMAVADTDDLEKEVDSVEDAMITIGVKVDALDKKVSEGFDDIKEELRYLRRKK